jgi:DNA polymerase IV (DinB-like DNA polymerase)
VFAYFGRSEDSGAVSTENYIARKYGVRSGMCVSLARKRLEQTDVVFLPVDNKLYGETSDRIMRILRGCANSFEQAGIEEAYLDVTEKLGRDFSKVRG